MLRHHHLFERIGTLENLIAAAHEALRGKRMRRPGAGFLADFEKEVCALHEELWAGTYRHGGYHYFTIHEPKERVVAAAPFRDRVVHHAIVRVIEPIFERRFIEHSYACRTGKGTHAAMRRAAAFARRWPYALKCDVRKYFRRPLAECGPSPLGACRTGTGPFFGQQPRFLANHDGRKHGPVPFTALAVEDAGGHSGRKREVCVAGRSTTMRTTCARRTGTTTTTRRTRTTISSSASQAPWQACPNDGNLNRPDFAG